LPLIVLLVLLTGWGYRVGGHFTLGLLDRPAKCHDFDEWTNDLILCTWPIWLIATVVLIACASVVVVIKTTFKGVKALTKLIYGNKDPERSVARRVGYWLGNQVDQMIG
jgi:hypothetical protein